MTTTSGDIVDRIVAMLASMSSSQRESQASRLLAEAGMEIEQLRGQLRNGKPYDPNKPN